MNILIDYARNNGTTRTIVNLRKHILKFTPMYVQTHKEVLIGSQPQAIAVFFCTKDIFI